MVHTVHIHRYIEQLYQVVFKWDTCSRPVILDVEHLHSSSENNDIAGNRKLTAAPWIIGNLHITTRLLLVFVTIL